RPPRAEVRVVALRGQDGPEPALRAFVDIELELVHALQVEDQAAAAAVDLEAVEVLAPGAEARELQRAERAVLEAQQRQRSGVDVDRRRLRRCRAGRSGDRSLLREGLQ